MPLQYLNLDTETRGFMAEELAISVEAGKIYLSNYLTDNGKQDWLPLLSAACESGTDIILGNELRQNNRLKIKALRKKPRSEEMVEYDVPFTAHETLAEGQFNRLYIRAMCRRALKNGQTTVRVYRAAEREKERQASIALVDTDIDATELLAKLRDALDFNTGFPEPNTGLCVTLTPV